MTNIQISKLTDQAEEIASLFENSARDSFIYVSDESHNALAARCIRACIEAAKEENWYYRGYAADEDSLQLRGDDGSAAEFFQRVLLGEQQTAVTEGDKS